MGLKYRKILHGSKNRGSINAYFIERGLFFFNTSDTSGGFWNRSYMLRYYKKRGSDAMLRWREEWA